MHTILKLFVVSGVPFAIFMCIYYSLRYNIRTGIMAGLTGGTAVGIVLAVIVGFLHRRCVQKIAGRGSDDSMGVHAVRNIDLAFPLDRTFDLCIESLGHVNRSRITQEDRAQGRIEARTGINWKTWGDTISFSLDRLDEERTHVMISSRPTARTTLVDFGKNLGNVQTIVSFLKRNH